MPKNTKRTRNAPETPEAPSQETVKPKTTEVGANFASVRCSIWQQQMRPRAKYMGSTSSMVFARGIRVSPNNAATATPFTSRNAKSSIIFPNRGNQCSMILANRGNLVANRSIGRSVFVSQHNLTASSTTHEPQALIDEWPDDSDDEVEEELEKTRFVPPAPKTCPKSCPLRPSPVDIQHVNSMTLTPSLSPKCSPPTVEAFKLVKSKKKSKPASPSQSPQKSPQTAAIACFVTNNIFDPTHDWRVHYVDGPKWGERIQKCSGMERNEYESDIVKLGSCIDWEQFAERYTEGIHKMPSRGTMWLFKTGISPVWEDPANRLPGAGKWVIPTEDRVHSIKMMKHLMEAEARGELFMNGLVLTQKFKQDMVMVWTNGTQSKDAARVAVRHAMSQAGLQEDKISAVRFKPHKVSKSLPPSPECKGRTLADVMTLEEDSEYESASVHTSPVMKWKREPNRFLDIADEFCLEAV